MWQTNRRAELPPNWETLRKRVQQRAGGRCESVMNDVRCYRVGRDCDHITDRTNHTLANLQWLCPPCHNEKTQREAQAARPTTRRPTEQHPGLT